VQNLSENSVEGVRKTLSIMSFLVIVFFFADGQLPTDVQKVKLNIISVEFNKSIHLLYTLFFMYAWFVVRYFHLGALRILRDETIENIKHYVKNSKSGKDELTASFYSTFVPDGGARKGEIGEYEVVFEADNNLVISRYIKRLAQNNKYQLEGKDFLKIQKKVLFLYGAHLTFVFPLLLSLGAIGLLIARWNNII